MGKKRRGRGSSKFTAPKRAIRQLGFTARTDRLCGANRVYINGLLSMIYFVVGKMVIQSIRSKKEDDEKDSRHQ